MNEKINENIKEIDQKIQEEIDTEYKKMFGEGGFRLSRAQRRFLAGKRKKRI